MMINFHGRHLRLGLLCARVLGGGGETSIGDGIFVFFGHLSAGEGLESLSQAF